MPAQAKGKKSKKTVENLTQRLALVRDASVPRTALLVAQHAFHTGHEVWKVLSGLQI
jgi:hypothetical protein